MCDNVYATCAAIIHAYLFYRQFSILQTLLGSDSTAIKIASGQAISLLFELARENDLVITMIISVWQLLLCSFLYMFIGCRQRV